MPPDSTATKARLFEAAVTEFAAYGLAGARVDRIAKTVQANKRLIYVYYGSKEQLFDTVLTQFPAGASSSSTSRRGTAVNSTRPTCTGI